MIRISLILPQKDLHPLRGATGIGEGEMLQIFHVGYGSKLTLTPWDLTWWFSNSSRGLYNGGDKWGCDHVSFTVGLVGSQKHLVVFLPASKCIIHIYTLRN